VTSIIYIGNLLYLKVDVNPMAPFWASTGLELTLLRIWTQLFMLMRIRIQLPKIMQIRIQLPKIMPIQICSHDLSISLLLICVAGYRYLCSPLRHCGHR
jgi:hypothetical protein